MMGRRGALAVLLTVAVAVLAARLQQGEAPPQFEKVAGRADVYKLTQWWWLLPGVLPIPITVGLVREGRSWALVDAGARDNWRQAHATHLLAALRAVIPEGEQLRVIALTHGHPDHVGALPLLLEAYPEARVALYGPEKLFLVGGEAEYWPQNGTLARVFRWIGYEGARPVQVPADRVLVLEEFMGDLSDVGFESMSYIATPFHTRGHASYLHTESRVMFAGDAVSFLWPSLGLASQRSSSAQTLQQASQVFGVLQPVPSLPGLELRLGPYLLCPQGCNLTDTKWAICMFASGIEFDLLLAGHDGAAARGITWTKEQMKALAASLPECKEFDQPEGQAAAHVGGDSDVYYETPVEAAEDEENDPYE